MSERNYYVLCDDNCRFESMTKEQILAAIYESSGYVPSQEEIDAGFITKIKEMNKNGQLKWWVGTEAEYNAVSEKDDNTLYVITDGGEYEDIVGAIEANSIAIENLRNDSMSFFEWVLTNEEFDQMKTQKRVRDCDTEVFQSLFNSDFIKIYAFISSQNKYVPVAVCTLNEDIDYKENPEGRRFNSFRIDISSISGGTGTSFSISTYEIEFSSTSNRIYGTYYNGLISSDGNNDMSIESIAPDGVSGLKFVGCRIPR